VIATTYQLHVTLLHIDPPIWRRLRVPGELSLAELHRVLQISMGWTESHLHQFELGKRLYGVPDGEDWGLRVIDERTVRLSEIARAKSKLIYEYDFGDGWRHEIRVERVESATEPELRCIDGARACPPEDVGGPGGYEGLLAAMANPDDSEHQELLEWVDPSFDSEAFDLAAIQARLAPLQKREKPKRAKQKRRNPPRIIDATHFIRQDGAMPAEPPQLRALAVLVASIIERGALLEPSHAVQTLLECARKPGSKRCPGLLVVEKLPDHQIVAICLECQAGEIYVHNWESTCFASGPLDPVCLTEPDDPVS